MANTILDRTLNLVAQLESRIAELKDDSVKLEFRPATSDQIEAFEAKSGHKLPPSYRTLLLEKGAIKVDARGYEAFWMFGPDELSKWEPLDWVDEGESEVDEAVESAIYFAFESTDSVENFIAFNPQAQDENGEMGVVWYYHDERFELDNSMGSTFADYIKWATDELFDTYLD